MNLAEMMRIIPDVREEIKKGNKWRIRTKFFEKAGRVACIASFLFFERTVSWRNQMFDFENNSQLSEKTVDK